MTNWQMWFACLMTALVVGPAHHGGAAMIQWAKFRQPRNFGCGKSHAWLNGKTLCGRCSQGGTISKFRRALPPIRSCRSCLYQASKRGLLGGPLRPGQTFVDWRQVQEAPA